MDARALGLHAAAPRNPAAISASPPEPHHTELPATRRQHEMSGGQTRPDIAAEPTLLTRAMAEPTVLNSPAAEPTVLNTPEDRPIRNDAKRAGPPDPPNLSLENRLVASAIDMLLMLTALRQSASHPNPNALQAELLAKLRRFEALALASGCAAADIGHARYVLCAALDEAVLSTPWGAGSVWVQQSLLIQLHQENWGGEKVFAILERSCGEPERHFELIELIDHCLTLGFQGRFRLMGNGVTQLEELRRLLRRTLAGRGPSAGISAGGNLERLGPAWSPVILRRGLPGWVPFWVVIVAALGGGLLAYSLFLNANETRIDAVVQSIRAIAPAGP